MIMQSKSKKTNALKEVNIDCKNQKGYNDNMIFQLRNKGGKEYASGTSNFGYCNGSGCT